MIDDETLKHEETDKRAEHAHPLMIAIQHWMTDGEAVAEDLRLWRASTIVTDSESFVSSSVSAN